MALTSMFTRQISSFFSMDRTNFTFGRTDRGIQSVMKFITVAKKAQRL